MTRFSQVGQGLILCLAALTMWGQSFNGRIAGTVTDSTGGVLQRASVTVVNEGTGAERRLTTDTRGLYVASELPVGYYTIRFESDGLTKVEQAPRKGGC